MKKRSIVRKIRSWFIDLWWSEWKVRRTIWPDPEGYGTYRKNFLTGKGILLDTGLSREEAKKEVDRLNSYA